MNRKNFLRGLVALLFAFTSTINAQTSYSIYPIPQEQISGTESFSRLDGKFEIVCEEGIDRATKVRLLNLLAENNATNLTWTTAEELTKLVEEIPTTTSAASKPVIYLGLNGSEGAADQKATQKALSRNVFSKDGKFDRHLLSITSSGAENNCAEIIILGEHTDAVFHGLASLEQILEQSTEQSIAQVTLYDYADQQSRGLVEGYYGYPYTIAVKKDLMRFMMRNKMNTYLYGAKSDPYHSQYWKDAYPKSLTEEQEKNGWLSQDMVREISEVSQATKVNFIWAIHPGNDFTGSASVVNDIMGKFEKMYDLGVRQFAVFVDDVSVPNDAQTHQLNAQRLTDLQRAIEKKWNAAGTQPTDTVKPIHFVPQVYASSFVAENVRRSFFQALSTTPKHIVIYTTGWGVWSVPNSSDLNVVKQDLGRNVAWWWNYPCNDNADSQLFPMDMYSNFYDMPSVDSNATLPADLQNGLGIVSNPMQEGEVSKIPLFSVADYAWNNSSFNNAKSWKAACDNLVGKEHSEALQLLAKYLRYNDPAELNTLISNYKRSLSYGNPTPAKLNEEMSKLLAACQEIESYTSKGDKSAQLLYTDLKPWLLKLKQMATTVSELLTVASLPNDDEQKWTSYVPHIQAVSSLDTAEEYKAYALEGMGSWISVSVRPSQPAQLYLYPFTKYMVENALGDFFGEVQTKPVRISNIVDASGNPSVRNDVNVSFSNATNTLNKGEYIGISLVQPTKLASITIADTLLSNYEILYSVNGKEWTTFTTVEDALKEHIKYLCVKNNNNEPRSLRLTRNNLILELPVPTEINSVSIPSGEIWDGHTAQYMYDGDYNTFVCLNRNQQNNDVYQLKLSESQIVGDVRICMGTVNQDYMNVGVVEVSADGKTWRKLRVKGTGQKEFTMSLPQVVKYSDEMSYIDFTGDSQEAQYVRLLLKTANTNKWLRLYEIEVNRQQFADKFMEAATDDAGNGIETLNDALGYTGITNKTQSIVYHFQQHYYLSAVEIYSGADANKATVSISEDGSTWKSIGDLSGGKQSIDMSEYPAAKGMKIEWQGENAPAIYEIKELPAESELPEVTKIDFVETNGDVAPKLHHNGTKWEAVSTQGLREIIAYAADGKIIYRQKLAGQHQTLLLLPSVSTGMCVVKITDQKGQQSTYKLTSK